MRPCATTSKRRQSKLLNSAKSMSRWRMRKPELQLFCTLGPQRPPTGSPFSPAPLPRRTLHMDRGRSKCKRLHRKTRKGRTSTRVAPDAASSSLELSLRPGHPTWGCVGSGPQKGVGSCQLSKPASRMTCLHSLTDWKHVNKTLASNRSIMRSATAGCRCLTMRRESANSSNVRHTALAPRYPIQARLPRVQGVAKCSHKTGCSAFQNLTKACPHVLVVASGKRLGVLWPQSAQPEMAVVEARMRS